MRATMLLAALFVLVLLSPACKTLPTGPDNDADAPSAEQLLAAQRAYTRSVFAVEAEANLELTAPERHDRVDVTFIVKKPDKALVELSGPTGLLAIATITSQEFRLYDARAKRATVGPTTAHSMAQVMPWVVMPQQFTPILCATPPLLNATPAPVQWDSAAKKWLVVLEKGALVQKLWFGRDGRLMHMGLYTKSNTGLRLNYAVMYLKWRDGNDGALAFPRYIRLNHPQSQTMLELRLHGNPTLNAGERYPDEMFMLTLPEGTPIDAVPGDPGDSGLPAGDLIEEMIPSGE